MTPQRFVVSVGETATEAQLNAITNYLRPMDGVGFWHHIARTWLLVSLDGKIETAALRDKINELAPTADVFVVELKIVNWATTSSPDGHAWLEEHFKLDE
jgi:hypothetical protein